MAKTKAQQAAEAAADTAADLVAIEPIRHDGVDIAPGETFTVDTDTALILVDARAAKPAEFA